MYDFLAVMMTFLTVIATMIYVILLLAVFRFRAMSIDDLKEPMPMFVLALMVAGYIIWIISYIVERGIIG